MASLQTQSPAASVGFNSTAHNRITKNRSKVAVKPILKKLHSGHSGQTDKNSLDLDRSWDEQTVPVTFTSLDYGSRDDDAGGNYFTSGGSLRSSRDVSFDLSSAELSTVRSSNTSRSKYSHTRSTSGTSHASTATSTTGRNGSFVHPFQQTPLTSTPPLSYGSRTSLDTATPGLREYSPVISEDDPFDVSTDSGLRIFDSHAYPSSLSTPLEGSDSPFAGPPTRSFTAPVAATSHSERRRPSLAGSHHTESLSDVAQSSGRMASTYSNASPALRSAQGAAVNQGLEDLQPSTASASAAAIGDSPISSTAPHGISPLMHSSQSSSTNPISPLRNSLEMNGFRLRSRSEVDTVTRQEQVRQARRKFEEKEKAKEEKYAREQIRKRERADTKEAQRMERAQAQTRKGSLPPSARNSTSTDLRPSAPRKSMTAGNRRFSDMPSAEQLDAFATRDYDSLPTGDTPRAEGVQFQKVVRRKDSKRKNSGGWTAFSLWVRTRMVKASRK